jgi:hypothetical protein
MAKTKKITLYYRVRRDEVTPPHKVALERKDGWIKSIQEEIPKSSKKDPDPNKIIRLTYEIFNPEILDIARFFNGPVVEYFAIQNEDMLEGRPGREMIKRYREQILDDCLGYDVEMVDRTVRRRKSTADFLTTQKWSDFLQTLEETHFAPEGYEFPDSESFWGIEAEHGYERAAEIAIKQLQERIRRKTSADTEVG